MKTLITAFLLLLLMYTAEAQENWSVPQGCPRVLTPVSPRVSTDPDNPIPSSSNPALPDYYSNEFDWRLPLFPSFFTPLSIFNPTSTLLNPSNLVSPFYNGSGSFTPPLDYLVGDAGSDFQPIDGWELLHVERGYTGDNVPETNEVFLRQNPGLILYNRYSGQLRILGSLQSKDNTDQVNIIASLATTGGNQANGLFALHSEVANPLDKPTEESFVVSPSFWNGNHLTWFHADVPVGYDPCVCNFPSGLQIGYETINKSELELEGRLLGVTEQIVDGVDGVLDDKNWLVSFDRTSLADVGAGVATYKKIDELEKAIADAVKYNKELKKRQNDIKIAQTLIKGGAFAATLALGGGFLIPAAAPIAGAAGSKLAAGSKFFKTAKAAKTSFDNATKGLSLFSSLFGKDGLLAPEEKKVPTASILHGEMRLLGSESDYTNFTRDQGIDITVPGSNGAFNEQVTLGYRRYPNYNEPLGLFALLKTPSLGYDRYRGTFVDENGTITGERFFDVRLSFDGQTDQFQYALNSVLDWNYDETEIEASIIIEFPPNVPLPSTSNEPPLSIYNLDTLYQKPDIPDTLITGREEDGEIIEDTTFFTRPGSYVLSTPILPLECLANLEFGFSIRNRFLNTAAGTSLDPFENSNDTRFYIRFYNLNTFETIGSDGFPNQSYQVYTYPIDFIGRKSANSIGFIAPGEFGVPTSSYSYSTTIGIPFDTLIINEDPRFIFSNPIIHTTSGETAVWDSMIISANIQGPSGSDVYVYSAGVGVDVRVPNLDPATSGQFPENENLVNITGNVDIKVGPNEAWDCLPEPIQRTDPAAFCSSSDYKANQFASKQSVFGLDDDEEEPTRTFSTHELLLYPNPTTGTLKLQTNLSESQQAQIHIVDITGKTVLQQQVEIGPTEAQIDMGDLAAGLYLVRVRGEGIDFTQKIQLIKR